MPEAVGVFEIPQGLLHFWLQKCQIVAQIAPKYGILNTAVIWSLRGDLFRWTYRRMYDVSTTWYYNLSYFLMFYLEQKMPSWFVRLGFKSDFQFYFHYLQFKKEQKIFSYLKHDSRKAANGDQQKDFTKS